MRINVVHAVPQVSSAYGIAEDGFTAAMEIVARRHDVRWLNVHPYNDDHREQEALITDCDFVLVRSDWGWLPARAADRALRGRETPVGLLIAGSTLPPPLAEMLRYDVLFYETPWYAQFVTEHPFAVQAFGVDTRFMCDRGRPLNDRRYDWVMVGRLASFKRPERLLTKSGRRLAIGDFSVPRPEIEERLKSNGVELMDQRTYADLADIYNDAKGVFVPCELQDGGERAVLEGRACGCRIEISDDNPKLASLLDCPIWSHEEYAERLLGAIEQVEAGRVVPRQVRLSGQRAARNAVMLDKIRRLPSTLQIRAVNAWGRVRTQRGGAPSGRQSAPPRVEQVVSGQPIDRPGATIVVASYNHAKYVDDCLASVAAQDYPQISLIVTDDASSDGSVAAIEDSLTRHGLTAVTLFSSKNRGICATFNAALEAVRTPYVAFLAADDWMDHSRVSRQVAVLEAAAPDVALVYGDLYAANADGTADGTLYSGVYPRSWGFGQHGDLYQLLLLHDFIPAPSVLARTESLRAVGGYDERLAFEDHDMFLRLAARYQFAFLAAPLVFYRQHPASLGASFSGKRARLRWETRLLMYSKHLGVSAGQDRFVAAQMYEEARAAYRAGSDPASMKVHLWRWARISRSAIALSYAMAAQLGFPGTCLPTLPASNMGLST